MQRMNLRGARPLRHWPSELLLLLALAALVLPFVFTSVAQGDEFTILNGALRQVQGQVIYRDYFELTAPLATWLLVPIFKFTGPSLLAARTVQALLLVVAGRQLYGLARGLEIGPWTSTLPGLILVIGLYRVFPGYLHHWMVLPFLLGALQAAMRGIADRRARWWGLAGFLAGLALLSMQTDGVALLAALGAFALLQWVMGGSDLRLAANNLVALGGGTLLAVAPAIATLAAQHALGPALYDLLLWPLQHYKLPGNFNDVKFGTDLAGSISPYTDHWVSLPYFYAGLFFNVTLVALMPLAALLLFAWGLPLLGRRLSGGGPWTRQQAAIALIGLATLGLEAVLLKGRADTAHTAIYAFLVVLLACLAADRLARLPSAPELALMRRLPYAGLLLLLACGAVRQAYDMKQHPEAWLRLESPDRRLAASPVIRYLHAHAQPGDRIVGMPFGGYFYFYGLPPATRYTLFAPTSYKYQTSGDATRLLGEIASQHPRFVLVSSLKPDHYFAEFLPRAPEGYRQVAAFKHPQTPDREPVYIFERISAASGTKSP